MAENSGPESLVVCDAGPLIYLDELGCLGLSADFDQVLVLEAVWQEVSTHRLSALDQRQVTLIRIAPEHETSAELDAVGRNLSLHRGELQALQLAQARKQSIPLTDDTAARFAARNLGIRAHGTVGVVVHALRRGQRSESEVIEILRSIPVRSTLHLRASLLADVIRVIEG